MNRRAFWTFAAGLAAALLLLAGCGQKSGAPAGDRLSQIKERGELVVAMEGTWSPWTYHDESDNLVGYDTEVAAAIAEKLGVSVRYVEGEFDGLLAGLEAGRYDIMVNGMDIDEERQEKFDFTDPYAYGHVAVIVRGDNAAIQTMEDLAGKHTANTITSTYAKIAEQYGAEVTGVDDLNQTFELLFSDRIDATLNAEDSYYDYMKAHPEADAKIACLAPDATLIAIPVPKGETALVEAVNAALAELREEGVLTELSMKYFDRDISQQ